MIKKVILVGYFSEIIELCRENNIKIVGYFNKDKLDDEFNYLGDDSEAINLFKKYSDIPLLIIPDEPIIRQKLFQKYSKIGYQFIELIHPKANISESCYINEGTIIQYGVNISSDSNIGKFCKINTYVNIMHNCLINDFVTIAPNAVLLGNVRIGKFSYIGANSTILPNINIGEKAVVGAGAVVTKDIPDREIVIGNPAKKLKK